MSDKYILRITAGPDYDTAQHAEVPVNRADVTKISGPNADVELNVRVKGYRGLPRGSPESSAYFETEPHAYNQDQYSICFRFTPRKPEGAGEDEPHGVSGLDLQFGNDFDRPIRDRLPPGFNTAMGIVRWWIDPGLDGDAYADKPYLYGPALSSFNTLRVGPGVFDEARGGLWIEEGEDLPPDVVDDGGEDDDEIEQGHRDSVGMPADAAARKKWALGDQPKKNWLFEYGKTYGLDFFNPYVDFANFALRLPGFHLPVLKFWDGQGLRSTPRRSHQLRYVLRNKSTGAVYLVVMFTLYLKEDVNEDGTIKEGVDVEDREVVDGQVQTKTAEDDVD
ncbi:hypothetical protein N3K66_008492 [Trichothecium roseum]|uniref:Uncharacterized protein n=1 Tax=Trichothecium roseum TaxID=47278 RepID=A0ACC0UQJ7_9HYPO|nr:hypothetical protein N3K66_008492 [Trichothecium roseum]